MFKNDESYNWQGIAWKDEPDVEVCKKIWLTDANGSPVMHRGKRVHPSRERVRQKRLEIYFNRLRRALEVPGDSEPEKDVCERLRAILENGSSGLCNNLRKIMGIELPLDSPLRLALADASQIYRPKGWHSRKGTARERILNLPVTLMTAKEVALASGCKVSYVAQVLRQEGVRCKRAPRGLPLKYDWGKIQDWQWSGPNELTDVETAKLIGCPNPMVVYQYRWRNGKKKFRYLNRQKAMTGT